MVYTMIFARDFARVLPALLFQLIACGGFIYFEKCTQCNTGYFSTVKVPRATPREAVNLLAR